MIIFDCCYHVEELEENERQVYNGVEVAADYADPRGRT